MSFSVFWHQGLIDEAPLSRPAVLDRARYERIFARDKAQQASDLTVPWPPHQSQGFWERYLGPGQNLASVRRRLAERTLIPLRSAAPVNVVADGDGVVASCEGFLHPWGSTFVVTVKLSSGWPDLPTAMNEVMRIRRDRCFALGNAGDQRLRLDEVGEVGQDALRALAHAAADGPRYEAFSVFSLTGAEGSEADFDPTGTDSAAARFLQATTTFSPTWQKDVVRPAGEAKVAGKSAAPASHLIYGTARARAIWSPAHFLAPPVKPPLSTLTCHHRNLLLASIQTEALARFAAETAGRLGANTQLSNEHRSQADKAVVILEGLHSGSKQTYRSGSLAAHLDQNQFLAPINIIRAASGLAAIA